MLSIFSSTARHGLDAVARILGRSSGGVLKRVDQNRELLELLQRETPHLLARHPEIVGWLKEHDDFFNELAQAVPLTASPYANLVHEGVAPRPWPVVQPKTTPESWQLQAYPLKQITIQVQGTRHSDTGSLLAALDEARLRLAAGDLAGAHHDDDFGYRFQACYASSGPSFFDGPCTQR